MIMTADQIVAEIQTLYRSDSMPWIVGYSGGKDSTASLQLVWAALVGLSPEERTKMVYVIGTDTLVENPVIAAWVRTSLLRIDVAAKQQGLNIKVERLIPAMGDRFWVNLIGKGYPAPRPKFRWCIDRLKISASTKFIHRLTASQGEALLILGQRRSESKTHNKAVNQHKDSARNRLSKNKDPKLSRVWVYPPIESWTSDDVWEYLNATLNPWGLNNQELFDIYREATPDEESSTTVDTPTSSRGGCRFGCYVCTLAPQDKAMPAMIQHDTQKQWMQLLLDFRDEHLAADDRDHRELQHLGGRSLHFQGQLIHGPYTQRHREFLLKELLQTQKLVQESGRKQGTEFIELISVAELDEIRRIWVEEKGEIEDLVPKIYTDVLGSVYPGRCLEQTPQSQLTLSS